MCSKPNAKISEVPMVGFKSPTTIYVHDIQNWKKFVKIYQDQWCYGVLITAELSFCGDQKEDEVIFSRHNPHTSKTFSIWLCYCT